MIKIDRNLLLKVKFKNIDAHFSFICFINLVFDHNDTLCKNSEGNSWASKGQVFTFVPQT